MRLYKGFCGNTDSDIGLDGAVVRVGDTKGCACVRVGEVKLTVWNNRAADRQLSLGTVERARAFSQALELFENPTEDEVWALALRMKADFDAADAMAELNRETPEEAARAMLADLGVSRAKPACAQTAPRVSLPLYLNAEGEVA